ncbi:MAG: MerR family transcriptional regulator [Firmicutes bacterium]|nr:MerR family transcriptional regulator [Bacillota bacterium]
MIKRMLPNHIRELLGIGRSSMRYYMGKGLISGKKDENNGYTYFDGGDLLEIIDVAFYRNCMDADTSDIKKLTYASSLEEQEEHYSLQIDAFEEKIKRQQAYLEMLKNFDKQLKRALRSKDRIRKVHLDAPFYFYYPELDSHVDIRAELFQVSYWISEFEAEEDCPVYRRSAMMIGTEFVDILDADFPDIRYKKFPPGEYLYTVFNSDKEPENASMLEEIYAYAKEHHYEIAEPMFLRYLVTFRENGVRTHAYEAYVPLK